MVPAPPHQRTKRRRAAVALILASLASVLGPCGLASAADRNLWGYGVRSCDAYLAAVADADAGDAGELQRYEDWMTGFISALNLALAEDVLRGSGLESAMRGTRTYCRKHGEEDFFNAAMDHVRGLTSLR